MIKDVTKEPQHWSLVCHESFKKRLKRYDGKRGYEDAARACLDNFDTLVRTLDAGAQLQSITAGWFRPEPNGIRAISEQGKGRSLKAMRLYIYVVVQDREIHLLTIGDKNKQSKDIEECKRMVKEIRNHST